MHQTPTASFLSVLYKFHLFITFIVFAILFSFTYVPLASLQLQDTFPTHSINILPLPTAYSTSDIMRPDAALITPTSFYVSIPQLQPLVGASP